RRAAARLRRLPPAAPDRWSLPPRVSRGPRVRQRGTGAAANLGRVDLRGRRRPARPPPLPRALGRGAQPRRLARGRGTAPAARRGPGLGRGGGGGGGRCPWGGGGGGGLRH